jgi:hypothetical protein
VAGAVTFLVLRFEAQLFLGRHGTWATRQGLEMYRQALRRLASQRATEPML